MTTKARTFLFVHLRNLFFAIFTIPHTTLTYDRQTLRVIQLNGNFATSTARRKTMLEEQILNCSVVVVEKPTIKSPTYDRAQQTINCLAQRVKSEI